MWCNFTFVRVKLTNFKNDYDNDDDDEPDKFKKLDPRRAELAGKKAIRNLLKVRGYIFKKINNRKLS